MNIFDTYTECVRLTDIMKRNGVNCDVELITKQRANIPLPLVQLFVWVGNEALVSDPDNHNNVSRFLEDYISKKGWPLL